MVFSGKRLSAAVLLLSVIVLSAPCENVLPSLTCRSAILYDITSGTLLYENNADEVIPPASMTKLMTLHLAFKAIDEGRFSPDSVIPVSRAASWKSSPPRSSLMFIEEGQRVTLLELMRGLAVSSGNDAGVAVAEAVAGSLSSFTALMNSEAKNLGLTETFFHDSSGYSSLNRTTARDFARFCIAYLKQHPEATDVLHSLEEYTYPEKRNLPAGGKSSIGPVMQKNNNVLLGRLEGVDGLKTGFINESGYNIAITSERDGRRLLAVLMGGPAETGVLNRAIDSAVILSYGYYYFTTFYPQPPSIPDIRVYGGVKNRVPVTAQLPAVTLPREDAGIIAWNVEISGPFSAPFGEGQPVGKISLEDKNGNLLFVRDIVTAEGIERGNLIKRALDAILLFFARLLRLLA